MNTFEKKWVLRIMGLRWYCYRLLHFWYRDITTKVRFSSICYDDLREATVRKTHHIGQHVEGSVLAVHHRHLSCLCSREETVTSLPQQRLLQTTRKTRTRVTRSQCGSGVFRLGCRVGGAGRWFRETVLGRGLIGLSWWLIVNQPQLIERRAESAISI